MEKEGLWEGLGGGNLNFQIDKVVKRKMGKNERPHTVTVSFAKSKQWGDLSLGKKKTVPNRLHW